MQIRLPGNWTENEGMERLEGKCSLILHLKQFELICYRPLHGIPILVKVRCRVTSKLDRFARHQILSQNNIATDDQMDNTGW